MNLPFYIILSLSLLNVQVLCGQITGNVNVRDPKALAITEELQAALCGKQWTCIGLVEIRRGIRDEFEQYKTVEFRCDGEFKYYFNTTGTWAIVNEQFLKITVPSRPNSNPLINGAYTIYVLSDSTLVLGQILTSTGDWTKEYTFTRSPKLPANTGIKRFHPSDSLRNGKQVNYFSNGQVSSIESYHLVKAKISAEELFLNNYSLPAEGYDPYDSTRLVSVPDGNWTYYFPDGKIRATSSYDQTGKRIGRWVRFFSDGRLDETETYNDKGQPNFSDHYEYRKGETWPTIRRKFSEAKPVFILGNMDSVQIDQIDFHEVRQAGSYIEKQIRIMSLSNRKVRISVLPNSTFDITATQIEIEPHDSAALNLGVKIPAGPNTGQIQLKSDEWVFGLDFNSFGYHLSNADFDSTVKRTLPSKMFFHRVSDDYELEIISSRNEKFVPVSKQMNTIDLRKGQYQFTLIGPSGRKTIEVEIQ